MTDSGFESQRVWWEESEWNRWVCVKFIFKPSL